MPAPRPPVHAVEFPDLGAISARFEVATIAELKAYPAQRLKENDSVLVLGYHTAGDGGGGFFRWAPTSDTAENGGTVIAPTTGRGRWQRVYSGAVNARWYGAVGDGVADDYVSLTNALANHLVVNLDAGTYATSGRLTVRSNGALVGSNWRAVEIKAITEGMTVVIYGASSRVANVTINGDAKAEWGVRNTDGWGSHAHLASVRVQNCTEYGFVFFDAQNYYVEGCLAANNHINFALINHVANCLFVQCCGSISEESSDEESRHILVLADTTDARYPAKIWDTTVRAVKWVGGIHERGRGEYAVDIVGQHIDIRFDRVEFAAAGPNSLAVIRANAAFTGAIVMRDCSLNLGGRSDVHHFEGSAMLSVEGGLRFSGLPAGKDIVDLCGGGISSLIHDRQLLEGNSRYFERSVGGWGGSAGGSVSWDAATRSLVIAGSSAGAGGSVLAPVANRAFRAGAVARIRFYITEISGPAKVRLDLITATTSTTVKTALDVGFHEIHTVLTSDAIQGIRLAPDAGGGTTTFSVKFAEVYIY